MRAHHVSVTARRRNRRRAALATARAFEEIDARFLV
jgi:hypothetical protein